MIARRLSALYQQHLYQQRLGSRASERRRRASARSDRASTRSACSQWPGLYTFCVLAPRDPLGAALTAARHARPFRQASSGSTLNDLMSRPQQPLLACRSPRRDPAVAPELARLAAKVANRELDGRLCADLGRVGAVGGHVGLDVARAAAVDCDVLVRAGEDLGERRERQPATKRGASSGRCEECHGRHGVRGSRSHLLMP